MVVKKIKAAGKYIQAVLIPLCGKNLIILKGAKGYIMCGYLNLKAAAKFNDAAAKITGVSSIKEALNTKIHSLSPAAVRLGLYKGQPVKDALKIIA